MQEATEWSAKEIEYDKDRKQFPTLSARYQELFLELFGVFLPLDGAVSTHILRLIVEADSYNEMMFLIKQLNIELVHSEAYGSSAFSVPVKESEKLHAFHLVDRQPCVQAKTTFIEKYIDSDLPKSLRYVAAACSEGVFFVTLFALIFYFRSKGVLPGFILMNEQVMKDETLHRGYYCAKAKVLLRPEEHERARQIIQESVEVEVGMVGYLLRQPVDSLEADRAAGLTVENMSNYARGLGDQIAEMIGLPPIYRVSYEPPWCEDMILAQKNNFYEVRGGNYKKFSAGHGIDYKARLGLNTEAVVRDGVANPDDIDF